MNPLNLFYSLRSYVESYAGFVGRRFISVIWLIALCVVIWFYGYLIGSGSFKPLESTTNRLIAIALVTIIWTGYMIYSVFRSRKQAKDLVDGLENDADAGSSAEVDEIRTALKDALTTLRKVSQKRFGYIYELPWYVIFGAPGSGKTTALSNSGLKFPLGDATGGNGAATEGGTRSCNWWFAEEAILIDTAGRFTTQDDMKGASKSGWEGFLGLVKKHRSAQPINGAMVTLSIQDLLHRDPDAMRDELRAVRQRLSELDTILKARIPIYILLTKADILTGFTEFFDAFSRTDREQVWGMTFELNESMDPAGKLPGRFLEEFGLLQERVNAMLLERLQQEPELETRGRIFRFPAELTALRDRLHEAVSELSSGSQLMEPSFIRGIYMASGTQNPVLTSAKTTRERRSYFLSRLFREVMFEEAALVSSDKRLSRRQQLIRQGAFVATGVFLSVVLLGWVGAFYQNKRAIAEAEARIDNYERLVLGVTTEDVNDADFLRILPALDNLRNVTAGFEGNRLFISSFGLSQESKLAARQQIAYKNALNGLLLPRMMVQIHRTLDKDRETNEVFDTLKFYGMLGGLGPVDVDFVMVQAEDMFASLYPGEARTSVRESLLRHVESLASGVIDPINLDENRIAAARKQIADESIAARAFNNLVNRRDARKLPVWSPADPLGPLGEQTFTRKSKKSWREGVDGIFSQRGYHQIVLPHMMDAVRVAQNEEWVRGAARVSHSAQSVDEVAYAVLQQYFDAFRKRWEALLADIQIREPRSVADAAEIARSLAARPSPIETLARSIAQVTDLHGTKVNTSKINANALAVAGTFDVPDFYGDLRLALNKSGKSDEEKSPIAGLTPLIQALYGQLSRAATSTKEVARVFDVDSQLNHANQALIEEARRLPAPVDDWIAGMSAGISTLGVSTARANIREQWNANNRQLCSSIIDGRYPFDRKSKRDVAMSDFVRLFGPSGNIQTFFKERVAPFVDTSSSPWRWRGSFGANGPQSQALTQFENADKIRRAFFPTNDDKPSIRINIRPASLSPEASAVMLEVEGERVVYFHGPIQERTIIWPSAQNVNLSRVAFQPSGWEQALTMHGDWSPFRLFDQAKLTTDENDRFRASFTSGQYRAQFDVQFGSVLNPFRLDALNNFACPEQF